MLIYSKQQNIIVNTDLVKRIYISYELSPEIISLAADNFIFVGYKNKETAQKVLKQIFIAMTDGKKTFETPED